MEEMGYSISKQKHQWSTEKREPTVLSLRLLGTWGQVAGEPPVPHKGLLSQLGLERFHSVGIMGLNSEEWVIASIGAIMAG